MFTSLNYRRALSEIPSTAQIPSDTHTLPPARNKITNLPFTESQRVHASQSHHRAVCVKNAVAEYQEQGEKGVDPVCVFVLVLDLCFFVTVVAFEGLRIWNGR